MKVSTCTCPSLISVKPHTHIYQIVNSPVEIHIEDFFHSRKVFDDIIQNDFFYEKRAERAEIRLRGSTTALLARLISQASVTSLSNCLCRTQQARPV